MKNDIVDMKRQICENLDGFKYCTYPVAQLNCEHCKIDNNGYRKYKNGGNEFWKGAVENGGNKVFRNKHRPMFILHKI